MLPPISKRSDVAQLIVAFDRMIRRDPGRRGLIGSDSYRNALCQGHLRHAANSLSRSAGSVILVTGFFVPNGQPPSAETDGPLGTMLLASALQNVGANVLVVTDAACYDAVRCAAEYCGLPSRTVMSCRHCTSRWIDEMCVNRLSQPLTHLIAIERVGPSHTQASLAEQDRPGDAPIDEFESRVPEESRNRCHNMRGVAIDDYTADLHRLFERLPRRFPKVTTIGIGDGGNEIGMGAIPWEELAARLSGDHAACIPCRIATDWNIVAGTSNWGAYALAAATLLLNDRIEVLRPWNQEHQERMLEDMVERGPAVDGVTRLQEPTVDGLPFLTYIQPWLGIRRLIGLDGAWGKRTPQ